MDRIIKVKIKKELRMYSYKGMHVFKTGKFVLDIKDLLSKEINTERFKEILKTNTFMGEYYDKNRINKNDIDYISVNVSAATHIIKNINVEEMTADIKLTNWAYNHLKTLESKDLILKPRITGRFIKGELIDPHIITFDLDIVKRK